MEKCCRKWCRGKSVVNYLGEELCDPCWEEESKESDLNGTNY